MKDIEKNLPNLNISIDEDKIFEGATNVLLHIRPAWDKNLIQFKMFTDGITNKLVACSNSNKPDDVVLVRVYGEKTDLLIDRKAETRNLQLMHNAGYAPRLYATFINGLAYEYVPGDTLTLDTCRSLSVYTLIATMMAQMHKLECVEGPKDAMIWAKARQFIHLAPDAFSNSKKQQRFEELKLPSKSAMITEFNSLEIMLKKLNSPIVFCHNDLLLANVIFNGNDGKITFIDYEYAAYNHQAFDIGNHFNEFAGVTDVDYALYPDLDFQRSWLRVYLNAYKSYDVKNGTINDDEITDEQIEELLKQVNKFALASHFLWSAWGLVQAEHSTIDFDYLQYASIRLTEYFNKKDHFLAL